MQFFEALFDISQQQEEQAPAIGPLLISSQRRT